MAFSKFPKLPTELRLIIWGFCLPKRVVEVDMVEPDDRGTDDFYGCALIHTSRANAAPPVLSRVCRESRWVALEHGGLLANDDQLDISGFPQGAAKIWVDRHRDTVHADCGSKPLSIALWLAVVVRSHRQPSLRRHAFHADLPHHEYVSLMSHRNLTVVLRTLPIHALLQLAKDSGLFGLLGEERVVLVDADDTERKEQYRSFWEQHGRRPGPIATRWFDSSCQENAWVGTHVRKLQFYMFF